MGNLARPLPSKGIGFGVEEMVVGTSEEGPVGEMPFPPLVPFPPTGT